MMARTVVALASAAAMMLGVAGKAEAAPIPVELVLAIDASGSISNANYDLQKNAYANVLSSGLITTDGKIAIGVLQFGNGTNIEYGLQVIDSQAKKDALVAAINAMTRGSLGAATHIGTAVNVAQGMLAGLDFANGNQVIDVSTDGQVNGGNDLPNAVAAANVAGTVVNCLGVTASANCNFVNTAANLGGFSVTAQDFAAFQGALEKKIAQETGQVPEPTLMTLAGLGLVGLVVRRRVRR
jgi:hypothetical protein